MTDEKEILSAEYKRAYALGVIKNGMRKMIITPRNILFLFFLLSYHIALWEVWNYFIPEYLHGYIRVCYIIQLPVVVGFYLFFIGYVPNSLKYYRALIRAGIKNNSGEAPILIQDETSGNTSTLTFFSRGVSLIDWENKRVAAENALNINIASIYIGKNPQYIHIRCLPGEIKLPDFLPFKQEYMSPDDADIVLGETLTDTVHINLDLQPFMLIGGSTGSGKSATNRLIAYEVAARGATGAKDVPKGEVIIYDPKGLDYDVLLPWG